MDILFYYFLLNDQKQPEKIVSFHCIIDTKINRNFTKFTKKQEKFYSKNKNASVEEVWNCQLKDPLVEAKKKKCSEIEAYDISDNVNGFYYKDNFMWLDRDTRACLRNTIESLEIMDMEELNIWYNNIYVTLDLSSAKQLLASLEVYAMQCYNVTANHKASINIMDNIEDITNFDITADYPEMLRFGEDSTSD